MGFLSKILRSYREKKNLRRVDVAIGIGYKNTNKGIRKIEKIENYSGHYNSGERKNIAEKIASFLKIPDHVFTFALDEDACCVRNHYTHNLYNFCDPCMIVRFAPAYYTKKEVVGSTDTEREKYAKIYAKEHYLYVCLVLTNGNCVYIDKKGEVYSIVERGINDQISCPICFTE